MEINNSSPKIIVLTGPESSGKTTLASKLSLLYDLPLVKEFSRTYLENHGAEYDILDLEKIALCQNIQEKDAHNKYPIILCDTDIITIEIWAQVVFNTTIPIDNNYPDIKHYLLCKPDIPWTEDPLRENPQDRDRLFDMYESYLISHSLSYEILDKNGRANYTIIL